jgi:hypothetical protein
MWCAGDRRFIVGERYNPVCAEIACSKSPARRNDSMNANSGQSRPTLEDAFDNPKLNFVLASIARRVRDHF